ncbi:hypothetical protein ACPW96_05715 [Micromonospora sp. DT81.3]|uniref:hypothetical protein n=1 Tax=Actinomycetes TaxID=1760 RepID=UPI003CEC859D
MLPVATGPRTAPARRAAWLTASVALIAVLAACAPQTPPATTPSESPSSTPRPTATGSAAPSESPTPVATEDPGSSIDLPAACEDIYSEELLATIADMPLNDPGVTLLSTEMTAGLEILETAPTIRCSWGLPSDFGLATNVTIVDAAQTQSLEQSMRDTGMECADYEQGTLCRIETEHLGEDDVVAKTGETHYLRGNGWVSTHWINFAPEGYTEDIVATLWG